VGLLIDDEAWPRITRHIQATKGKTLASIAYLGVDSPDLLPLRRDDVLVCDASPASIAAGSTSPVALRLFMHRGVEVFSAPGLHAKVIVTARRLFIGSANASAHSRDHLIEAVLETTDQSAVRESKDFILGLATDLNEVTAPQLDELDRILGPFEVGGVFRSVEPEVRVVIEEEAEEPVAVLAVRSGVEGCPTA
jgi:hypothetical protein